MKLYLKNICKSSVSLGMIVRHLYKSKNINIQLDSNILTDFLLVEQEQKIFGKMSILQYLSQNQIIQPQQFDLQSMLFELGIDSKQQKYKEAVVINEIVQNLKQNSYLNGKKYGESDIIAFVSLDLEDILQNKQIFISKKDQANLVKWHQYIKDQIQSTQTSVEKELGIEIQTGQKQQDKQSFQQQQKPQQQEKQPKKEQQQQQKQKQKTQIKFETVIPTEKEQILFDYLQKFVSEKQIKVVLRCAGGWVRDKLLGVQSNDIDIALDTMTGEQFVLQLQEYAKSSSEPIRSVGVIKANPDQSKHLETATCKIKGFEIDFVNLRGEEYAENSRIPIIKFGNPVQDAERRDLTINALFYNITENKVEDFCGRGLSDLKQGICTTPLEPLKTFVDDPLRVLRTFRFSARYRFEIESKVLQAAQSPEVQKALDEKISRERMRTEFEKISRSDNAIQGISYINTCHLWNVMFQIPKQDSEFCQSKDLQNIKHEESFKLFQFMDQKLEEFQQFKKLISLPEKDVQMLFYFSACILPYTQHTFLNNKKKQISLAYHLTEISLKLGKNESDSIVKICEQALKIQQLVKSTENIEDLEIFFLDLTTIIKESKELWEMAFFFAKNYTQFNQQQQKDLNIDLKKFDLLYSIIYKNYLQDIYKIKPLLNGQDIQKFYGQGKIVGIVTKNMLNWQYKNYGKGKEQLQQVIEKDLKQDKQNQKFILQ